MEGILNDKILLRFFKCIGGVRNLKHYELLLASLRYNFSMYKSDRTIFLKDRVVLFFSLRKSTLVRPLSLESRNLNKLNKRLNRRIIVSNIMSSSLVL